MILKVLAVLHLHYVALISIFTGEEHATQKHIATLAPFLLSLDISDYRRIRWLGARVLHS